MTVPAPAGGTGDGPHAIVYHATDVATNAETPKTLTVNIDTVKPTAKALAAAAVRRGRTATLKYQVDDAVPNGGTAKVTIKIKNRSGKIVKVLRLGAQPVGTPLAKKFTCTLAKGTYKYLVYGTDTAGNKQASVGVNKLVVK